MEGSNLAVRWECCLELPGTALRNEDSSLCHEAPKVPWESQIPPSDLLCLQKNTRKHPHPYPQLSGYWSVYRFPVIRTTELRAGNLIGKSFSFWISPREETDLASKSLKDLGGELSSLDLCNLWDWKSLAELDSPEGKFPEKGGELVRGGVQSGDRVHWVESLATGSSQRVLSSVAQRTGVLGTNSRTFSNSLVYPEVATSEAKGEKTSL